MNNPPQLHVRKLAKVGGASYAVTLPIAMIRHLGWREHQKVVVELDGDTLIIKDWKK